MSRNKVTGQLDTYIYFHHSFAETTFEEKAFFLNSFSCTGLGPLWLLLWTDAERNYRIDQRNRQFMWQLNAKLAC